MGWLFATLLSKTDFSFALLLATFEPLEIYQSYIPFWKAQKCGINTLWTQGRGCMVTIYHTSLKMAILLHKEATVQFDLILAVLLDYVMRYFVPIRKGMFTVPGTSGLSSVSPNFSSSSWSVPSSSSGVTFLNKTLLSTKSNEICGGLIPATEEFCEAWFVQGCLWGVLITYADIKK